MTAASPFRRFVVTACCVWLALSAGFVALRHRAYFDVPAQETADDAVNALQIANAREGRELYGNYSRFEFHHPGPAFFYVYAAGQLVFHDWLHLTPAPGNAHRLASLLLQTAFFALGLAALATVLPPSFVPLALPLLAAYFHFVPQAFTGFWPPEVLMMPFFCFLTAGLAFMSGWAGASVLLVLAGGFLVHGHVAQPLFVGGLGAVFVVAHFRTLRRHVGTDSDPHPWHRGRPVAVSAAILAALFLLPLAIDAIGGGRESNLAAILGRFAANTQEHKTLTQSFLYIFTFAAPGFSGQDRILDAPGPATAAFFRAHVPSLLGWAALAVVAGAAAWRSRRDPDPAARCLRLTAALLPVLFVLCLGWGILQAGPMYQFNGRFYSSIYALLLLMPLMALAHFRLRRLPAVAISVLGALTVVAVWWPFRFRAPSQKPGLRVTEAVATALGANPRPGPRLLVFAHDEWPQATTVALRLRRQGFDYRVAPSWGFMFGYDHTLSPEDAVEPAPAETWWIAPAANGGIPLGEGRRLFTTAAAVNPQGDAIEIRAGGNVTRRLLTGLSNLDADSAPTDRPWLVFRFLTPAATGDIRVTFDATAIAPESSSAPPIPQPAEIAFSGTSLGRVIATARRAPLTVIIPREQWNRAGEATLSLHFPAAIPTTRPTQPRLQRWTAWRLWSIRFEPASP